MTRRHFVLVLAAVLWPAAAPAAPPAQWVVVVAPAFRAAVKPLAEQRRHQGMHVVVMETTDVLSPREIAGGDAGKLRDRVNKLCRQYGGTSYVLLVGAVEAGKPADAERTVLPPLPGTAGRMKGQPSDNGYGNPGKDLLATVAVGRFPARTAEEARRMVAKTLAYENDPRPGAWRRQVTVLAGVPAFNPFVDKLVQGMAMTRFARLDASWSGRAIYHNAQSPFCVPDDRLHDTALAYVQAGQAFTLYLGHSDAEGFYAGRARFLDREDWARMRIRRGPGVFATFGCNGCQLSGRDGEGYGVAAVRNPGGPAAVLGSHGICFAAMVELCTDGLFEGCFASRPPGRLGEAWLAIKAGLAHARIDALTFRLLDAVDGDNRIPQERQRLEHQEMFILLGDPALRLPVLATDVTLTTTGPLVAGKTLSIQGELPARLEGARVRLTLERPVHTEPADLAPLPDKPPEARAKVMMANHERANHFVLAGQDVTSRGRTFESRLTVPARLPWRRLVLRAYAVQGSADGLGVLPLKVIQPQAGK